MNRGWNHGFRVPTVLLVVMSGAVAVGDPFGVGRYSVDGGGVMRSIGGDFELSGTIGQPDVGERGGEDFELTGGFWFSQVPADCDADGGVNLFDFAAFHACTTGSGNAPVGPECVCFDLDGDGDVDLLDFGAMQFAFSG